MSESESERVYEFGWGYLRGCIRRLTAPMSINIARCSTTSNCQQHHVKFVYQYVRPTMANSIHFKTVVLLYIYLFIPYMVSKAYFHSFYIQVCIFRNNQHLHSFILFYFTCMYVFLYKPQLHTTLISFLNKTNEIKARVVLCYVPHLLAKRGPQFWSLKVKPLWNPFLSLKMAFA